MNNENIKREQWRSRRVFLAIVAVFFVPLLSAIWLYRVTDSGSPWASVNKGALITPARPLLPFSLRTSGRGDYGLDQLLGKWTMVFIPPSTCDDVCKKNIYHMRQIRMSLGREMHRVQRLLIFKDEAQSQQLDDFLQHYPDTVVVFDNDKNASALKQFDIAQVVTEPAILLVDPLGNLMMVFPQSLEPKKVLKDLKKLLKISKIG